MANSQPARCGHELARSSLELSLCYFTLVYVEVEMLLPIPTWRFHPSTTGGAYTTFLHGLVCCYLTVGTTRHVLHFCLVGNDHLYCMWSLHWGGQCEEWSLFYRGHYSWSHGTMETRICTTSLLYFHSSGRAMEYIGRSLLRSDRGTIASLWRMTPMRLSHCCLLTCPTTTWCLAWSTSARGSFIALGIVRFITFIERQTKRHTGWLPWVKLLLLDCISFTLLLINYVLLFLLILSKLCTPVLF